MIYVQRMRFDEDGVPIQPDAVWFAKAESWTVDAIRDGVKHRVSQSVYGDDKVRAALVELFRYKCAYCEKSIRDYPWEIEHFRPKGRVEDCPDHPGYYWLAYEWDNLYPSCDRCNRILSDPPAWPNRARGTAAGKGCSFSLEDEDTRAMRPEDDIKDEVTHLIDPCFDTPLWYLEYEADGNIKGINGNPFGEVTVETFNLRRHQLTILRKIRIGQLVTKLQNEQDQRRNNDIAGADETSREIQSEFLEDGCTFAGLCRFVDLHPERFGVKG